MTPAMDAAPEAEIPAAAPGVGVEEDAEPEETDVVESWLLVPLVLEESVPAAPFEAVVLEVSVAVAVFEPAVVVDVSVTVVAAAL